MSKIINKLTSGFLDFFLPERCLVCSSIVNTEQESIPLCNAHRNDLSPLTPPVCHFCARPLGENIHDYYERELANEPICGNCRKRPIVLEQLLAGYRFESRLRSFVADWKYYEHAQWSGWFARKLWDRINEHISTDDWDLFVPIPLHERREEERGFNQAYELARGMSEVSGIDVDQYLIKKRRTNRQSNLSREERKQNLQGAFALNPGCADRFSTGESVLLVDDIYTTGSTLRTAATVLLQSGIKKVGGVVLGRTLPEEQ